MFSTGLEGTSLTVVSVDKTARTFSVMLIQYTQERVIMPLKASGDRVNLEVDQMGKYIESIVLNTLLGQTVKPDLLPGKTLLETLIYSIVDEKLSSQNLIK